jgi:hypothetical protein
LFCRVGLRLGREFNQSSPKLVSRRRQDYHSDRIELLVLFSLGIETMILTAFPLGIETMIRTASGRHFDSRQGKQAGHWGQRHPLSLAQPASRIWPKQAKRRDRDELDCHSLVKLELCCTSIWKFEKLVGLQSHFAKRQKSDSAHRTRRETCWCRVLYCTVLYCIRRKLS